MTPLDRLLDIMRILRDPETGCPWDREQTYASVAPYAIEEAYEVQDAIQRHNFNDLRDELGDLLLQVVFQAQIASEEGRFTFDDICQAVSDKMVRRHPHIFADATADCHADTTRNWETIKQRERARKKQSSAVDDIPRALPALMRANKIQKRCSHVGFDWKTLPPVLDKVYEEINEVMEEVRRPVINEQKLEEEIGDLLFATVNFSRHLGSKAEIALQKANDKFERRFRQVELIISAQKMSMSDASLAQLEAAWQQVKQREHTDSNDGDTAAFHRKQ